jgi:hypothetical protein
VVVVVVVVIGMTRPRPRPIAVVVVVLRGLVEHLRRISLILKPSSKVAGPTREEEFILMTDPPGVETETGTGTAGTMSVAVVGDREIPASITITITITQRGGADIGIIAAIAAEEIRFFRNK